MNPSRFFHAAGPAATGPRARVRRRPRIALACETLETRQLLSTGTVVSSSAQAFLQVQPMASGGSATLTPQVVDSAYGLNNISFSGGSGQAAVSGTGAGQTIAIVDAYSDPNIQSDLAAFDAKYGLSAPPSFNVYNLAGTSTNAGWALETALDVELAHAIAPQANIVLVEAANDSLNSLLSAVSNAANIPNVSVVSMSWGSNEFFGEASYAVVFSTPAGHINETFVAASGDSGAWSGPSFPSVLPNVLAVGGTSLNVGSNGSYGSETGWSGSTGGFSGLNNGFRSGISVPSYQAATLTSAGLNYGLRTTPDVSFNADPNMGYAVYDSVPYNGSAGWFQVGGTSAAAPAWAGLVAIADQGLTSAGKSTLTTTELLTDLYSLPSSDFNDVTSGFNGYSAGAGYDLVTGLGTPKANALISGLLSASGVKSSAIATTPSSTASTKQATGSSAVHNAAVVTIASTGSASVVSTTAAAASSATGLAALPTPSSSTTSVVTATASEVTNSNSTSAALAAPVGLGQGSSASLTQLSVRRASPDERPSPATDAIDRGKADDPAPPAPPEGQPPAPDTPNPAQTPQGDADPRAGSESPAPGALSSTPIEIDGTLVGPFAPASAVRVDSKGRGDEEADVPPASAAGLVLGGAVIALGHRVVLGHSRRARPLTAAVRTVGRGTRPQSQLP
jgi:subtilase family serine protease